MGEKFINLTTLKQKSVHARISQQQKNKKMSLKTEAICYIFLTKDYHPTSIENSLKLIR